MAQTDDIFNNIKEFQNLATSESVKRLSIDCKATVNIGDYSRGGKTRGDNQASDHDMGCKEKYIPCGIVDEDNGQLHIIFGSSYKTSDFIVDNLIHWWKTITPEQRRDSELIQIKIDNGPESSGVRTQFLKRMVEFVDQINRPIQLLYYPPYHSKYNPIERCWGILEQHWNGTKLVDVETMLSWASSMTWKGLHPILALSNIVYQKGISLTKKAMKQVESRLQRNPLLPKWDILIRPL
ncbi:transposase (plasmid) [Nostoc sp. UHCC 0302]|uniref:ISAzo13-like element transposase-related protein n=1 Tax=Nostoc sp. UHCC 0302 TaxID=3134896 RepID=UPI00311C97A3